MNSTLLQPPPPAPLNVPTLRHLPNGLTVIAEQLPVEAVNLSLWLNVGSAIEADEINGMAHFLEHMVFKGTAHLHSGEFERLIEERGAITNAMTSQDYTHYYITTAPQDFAKLTPFQLEVVLNAIIPDEAFERERLVVLEETRRSEDNPRRRTFQHLMAMAFERLPYRRPVLGTVASIEQLSPEQMRDFHATWYQPSLMTAVAVGNLPVEELVQVVAESFDRVWCAQPEGSRKPVSLSPNSPSLEPAFSTIVRQDLVDESLQQARLVMTWRVPGLSQLPQTYALDILASLLGQGRTGRLIADLREEQRLVSSIVASNLTYGLQGIFYVAAQLPLENLAQVETLIAQHIAALQNECVSDAEIARVRIQAANRFVFGNETPSDRANLYGYFHSLVGDLTPALNYPASIQALDADRLQAAARRYLSPHAYGLITLRPCS